MIIYMDYTMLDRKFKSKVITGQTAYPETETNVTIEPNFIERTTA